MGDTTEVEDDKSGEVKDPPQPVEVKNPSENVIEQASKLDNHLDEDPSLPPSNPVPEGKKILKIRSDAMKEIKAKARDAGKREAEQAFAAQLKDSGFSSLSEMAAELLKLREKKVEKPTAKDEEETKMSKKSEAEEKGPDELELARRDKAAAIEAKRKANRARAREEKRRRLLQRRLDAEQAERELEREALRAGVEDTEYGLILLRRHLKKKKEAGEEDYLATFSAANFFKKDLRESNPHIYGTKERPANTAGAADEGDKEAGNPPSSNGANTPTQKGGGDKNAMNVRDMSTQEFHAELKKRGLSIPGAGF